MDEVYRGHRIAVRLINGQHIARVTEANGRVLPIEPRVDEGEGAEACMGRAKSLLAEYLTYVKGRSSP